MSSPPTTEQDQRNWILLHNPGSRAGARVFREVEAYRRERPDDAPLTVVALPELREFTETPGRIIAVGGDGTINAAAHWCADRGVSTPVAIVPAGTGNNLARGLGLPLDTEPALRIALESRRLRSVDQIQVSTPAGATSPLLQSGALGFPANIAARYDRLRTRPLLRTAFRPLGPYVYRALSIFGLLGQAREQKRHDARLHVTCELAHSEANDGKPETIDEDVFAVFIGNEATLGGNFRPCPRARVDDGKLDLCFVRIASLARYRQIFQQVVRGTHLDAEDVVVYRQSKGPVTLHLSRSVPLLVDGDLPLESKTFELTLRPEPLPFVVGAPR